jgi:hypothetical protein
MGPQTREPNPWIETLSQATLCGKGAARARTRCARTVKDSNVFRSLGLALSEKQIPRFVGNVSS